MYIFRAYIFYLFIEIPVKQLVVNKYLKYLYFRHLIHT